MNLVKVFTVLEPEFPGGPEREDNYLLSLEEKANINRYVEASVFSYNLAKSAEKPLRRLVGFEIFSGR